MVKQRDVSGVERAVIGPGRSSDILTMTGWGLSCCSSCSAGNAVMWTVLLSVLPMVALLLYVRGSCFNCKDCVVFLELLAHVFDSNTVALAL